MQDLLDPTQQPAPAQGALAKPCENPKPYRSQNPGYLPALCGELLHARPRMGERRTLRTKEKPMSSEGLYEAPSGDYKGLDELGLSGKDWSLGV